ncbi:MAG: hypothetical protein KBH45_12225 [Verrucomicrobia bacterium]|nr:hypothetical protein [Verrucomicrobiota bacterium]
MYLIVLCALAGGGFFVSHSVREGTTRDARREDVATLTRLCFESTNIHNTAELIAEAKRQNIHLNSPIPRDPSQPCYRLVNAYDPNSDTLTVNEILIEETNVTDERRVYVSSMDGSILARPAKR